MKIFLPRQAIEELFDDSRIGAILYSDFSPESKIPKWIRKIWSFRHNIALCFFEIHHPYDIVNIDGSITIGICTACRLPVNPRHPEPPCAARAQEWLDMNQMAQEANDAIDAMELGGECIECGLFNHEHAPDCWWGQEGY